MRHIILFLAANPLGTDRLALDREAKAIQVELERSGFRDRFELVTRWAAEPLDLLRELRKLRPTVVHFSGHGSLDADVERRLASGRERDAVAQRSRVDDAPRHGLIFQGPDGRPQLVSTGALAEAFEAAGSSVQLVVLNACYSEPHAAALLTHVDCVVGMHGEVGDAAARSFAIGFYGGLGEHESIAAAYKQGCAAIRLEGLPDADRPQFNVRRGVDTARRILASPPRPAGDPPSTVKTTDGEPAFIGREAELGSIAEALRDARVVVLHGAPGLGKSRLAGEYAHRHAGDYPGGMFLVPFERPPPVELARLLRHTDHPAEPGEPVEDQCRRALRELGAAGRTLLIYDAIADERTLRDWSPYEGRDVHVIATSTSAGWARAWRRVDVRPLRTDAERELVTSIVGPDASDRLVRRIVDKAGGVTVELCASAAAAYERICLGDAVEDVAAEVGDDTRSSFESAWTLLSADAQLAMQIASSFVTARFPLSLVGDAWRRLGKSPDAMERAIHTVRTRQLATRLGGDLQVHQLVAQFVRERATPSKSIRRSLYDGLLTTARAFRAHPSDLELRAAMLAHSPSTESWVALVDDSFEWHAVGLALVDLGQFAEALLWFERAVTAKKKGDVHGRVDLDSLGASLHQVGDCYARQGQYAEALPWLECAVAAAEKGDVYGRVHPESLGRSLAYVGICYARQGQYTKAQPWFERAVAAAEKGDVDGRVDPASLGRSLHEVGDCHARQGEYAEALPWFERAVAAQEKGDVDGRVDPESLGTSLHDVGVCYNRQGQYAEAQPWFERAIAAKEKGDVHGRVDLESLGTSLHDVGVCYNRQGQYAEAQPWFERAIAAKEKGDVYGRVDPDSLGSSLAFLGDCYARQGRYADALTWLERAVAAQEKGDVHGRVDPESLGVSLHEVGLCYALQGQYAEAQLWFERAVAAAEKGDVYGRVDPESLGRSLHAVGDCYAHQGQHAEALRWFERAVAAAEKGDVHGRVDSESLGRSLHAVGDCYARQGQHAEAQPWFERAAAVQKSAAGE